MDKVFCLCRCKFSRNIYLRKQGVHVNFINRDDFISKWVQRLRLFPDEAEVVIEEIEEEIARRKRDVEKEKERVNRIREEYIPKHPDVYSLKESYFRPEFLEIWHRCSSSSPSPKALEKLLTDGLLELTKDRVYVFPVFTEAFCSDFLDEIRNFRRSEVFGDVMSQPNTMNRYGISLEEMGFKDSFVSPLRETYLNPIASAVFPDWVGNSGLDSHKSFIVSYYAEVDGDGNEAGGDDGLGTHFDNAEVTLNVSLNSDFTQGELHFGGMRTGDIDNEGHFQVDHQLGYGVFHRGQQRHGAFPIDSGERHNLIIWMRSSSLRNNLCPMCDKPPELVPAEGFGDGFTTPGSVPVCEIA